MTERNTSDLGPMRRALAFAVRSIPEDKRQDIDAATYALARHYAQLIDDSALPTSYADALAVLQVAVAKTPGTESDRALAKISAALSATTVAGDLGPKLLQALDKLGLTPASRGAVGGDNRGAVVSNTLDELRKRRDSRAARAGERPA